MLMKIEIDRDRRAFEPRQKVSGQVSWVLDQPPERLELRLFWYTEGKGTRDVGVVDQVDFSATAEGRGSFSLSFPDRPFSFSGRLLSIRWALELVAEPSGESQREELVMGPEGREVEVHESTG